MAVREQALEILLFELSGQRYGLVSSDVQELLRAVAMVPLPQSPAVVEGIINLRGSIVPVLDIRARFRLPAKPPEHTDHLVVACLGQRRVALRVDRVLDLVQLEAAEIEDAKGIVPGMEYVTWIAKPSSDIVLIHDLRTFLSQTEAVTLEEALSGVTSPAEEGAQS
jgi:purine-binding chemotaxis protein CheW